MNPRVSLIIALVLALLDGVETYIAVFKMGAREVMILTRILINHYGVAGLILDDAVTIALALALYASARLGGVVGFMSLVTLNSANALRLAVVLANAITLLTRHDTPLSIVITIGVVVGVILNIPLFKGACGWLRCGRGFRRSVGLGLHDFIVSKLYRAREVYIISPWISPETARLIISLVNRGVRIHLITTGDSTNRSHVSALRLLGAGQGSRGVLAIGILLIIMGIAFTVLTPITLVLMAPGAWLIYRGLRGGSRQVHANLTVRVIKNLHAKAILTSSPS